MVELPTEAEPVRVVEGDCLEVLRSMPDGCVDAVVTDPPYGINTKSDGNGKLSPWADLCNAAFWYAAWIGECRRVLKPTGCLWSCMNWRSVVTFQKAACDTRWPIESLMVWDKGGEVGPGGPRGLRPSYELVALWAMPEFVIADRGLRDLQRFKWGAFKPNGHPAEKPEGLMRFLIRHSCPRGGVVFDPFAGSGTTPTAAILEERRCLAVELDGAHLSTIRRRVREAMGTGLLAGVTP